MYNHMFSLRVDNREAASGIIDEFKNVDDDMADRFELLQEQLTVGDMIIEAGRVLIIERKSLADLAASLKDGRMKNTSKLLDARTTIGETAHVMYLIEGRRMLPDSPRSIGGIRESSLVSMLDHLMMKYKIQIEYTKNVKHSAARILQIGKNMTTMNQVVGGVADVGVVVKKKYETGVGDVQRDMLCVIRGIGARTATKLLATNTLREIICGEEKLDAPLKVCEAARDIHTHTAAKMLAAIKGVSLKLAGDIIAAHDISFLFDLEESVLCEVKRANGKRLGKAIATRVLTTLNHAR